MATHSSILAWEIPWTEEPGRLQSMGLLSRTRLSDFTFTFHFHALEKEMATHSNVLAWRIPGTEEPGGLPSMGSHRVGHDGSDLVVVVVVVLSRSFMVLWREKGWVTYNLNPSEQPSKARQHRPWCLPSPGVPLPARQPSPTRALSQLFNTETTNLIKQSNSKTKGKHILSQWEVNLSPERPWEPPSQQEGRSN